MIWIAVLAGGALGSAARYAVTLISPRLFGSATPYATAAVNLLGALIIGILAGAMTAHKLSLTSTQRAFYTTGILAGFTTFSSLMLDTLVMWQAGSTTKAIVNLVGQLLLGCALVAAGYRLGFGAQ